MILGIAESGRSAIIGPIVFAGIICEDNKAKELKNTNNIRQMKKIISDYTIIKIPPSIIDKENLNNIEIRVVAELINQYVPQKVFIKPYVPIALLTNYYKNIRDRILWRTEFIYTENIFTQTAKKLAQTTYKKEINKLIKQHGDFGSGYPRDAKTIKFIENWNAHPDIVRKKWITAKEVLVNKNTKIIVIGNKDTGKTELCKLFANIGVDKGYTVGILDLDVGQSHIGKPGSIGFGIIKNKIKNLLNVPPYIIYPVGSLSPAGVENKIYTGIKYILEKIPKNIDFIVIDTTGYIKGEKAKIFKLQKINLLNPDKIILLEKENELAHLISSLDKNKIYKLPIDTKVKKKTKTQRKKFRTSLLKNGTK